MSVWVTEEVMRWGLRFCSRSFRVTPSVKDASFPSRHLTHVWSPRQSQTRLSGSLVGSVRFCSQGRSRSDELGQRDHLPSPEDQLDETGQRQGMPPFRDDLPNCGSPSDVLDLTHVYSPTVRQVSNSLMHMWSITKKMSDEQQRYELQLMFEHPEFDKLLQRAMRTAGHMRNTDLAYSLLSMVSLGVPQSSLVVQTLLRSCQEKLNDFDERCLSILASSLKQMENSPNVVALKDAMRLVVEARLPSIKKVMSFQSMMHVVGKDAPEELKWKLEKKALSMADQFSLPNAQNMLSIMGTMGFYSQPLLNVCSKIITENLHGVPFSRLYKVLQTCKELLYRDLDLLTGISDYVTSTIDLWTNKEVILFLSAFESLFFSPDALMRVYVEKVIANPDALTLRDLLCVLKVYSSLNYDLQHQRQQFLDCLSHALDSYLPKMSTFALLKAVYSLCLLGHFPSAPLEQLLERGGALEQLPVSNLLKTRGRMIQMVDLCLRIDRPPLPRPLAVPSSLLGDPAPSSSPVNLSQDLRRVLGDQAHSTLQEMVVVENYFIDGVITKPLSSSAAAAGSCAGGERSPAESSQRIAVIYAPQSSCCYRTSHPRGTLAVKIRHLKILGYDPVLVTERELQSVPTEERTDFLRGRIFPGQKDHLKRSIWDLED